MKYYIDYYSAVHWLNSSLILFNEIKEFDPEFDEWEENNLEENTDIYQYFLTDWNENDVNWMRNTFPDVIIAYSNKLNMWILCVDHFGTAWNGVWTECNERIAKEQTYNEKGYAKTTLNRKLETSFMKCK